MAAATDACQYCGRESDVPWMVMFGLTCLGIGVVLGAGSAWLYWLR